jgi:Domain of unknown function (DUF5076)
MSDPNALEIPATVAGDPKATEIARIWAAHGQQHVYLRSGLWADAGNWGIMLVDLARHVANAYEQDGRGDYFEVLSRIRQVFEAEWDSPTDIARGKLTEEPPSDAPNA